MLNGPSDSSFAKPAFAGALDVTLEDDDLQCHEFSGLLMLRFPDKAAATSPCKLARLIGEVLIYPVGRREIYILGGGVQRFLKKLCEEVVRNFVVIAHF